MLFALFALLLAASALLAVEVGTGVKAPEAGPRRWLRTAVFALAACAGGTLLVALPLTEWLLILALLPLTAISILRFMNLLKLDGWRRIATVLVVLGVGVAVGIQTIPIPLTRATIQSALPGGAAPSAHPDAGRLVRT